MNEKPNTINIITGHIFGGILSVYETLIPFLNQHFNVNIITLNKNLNNNDPFFPTNKKVNLGIDPPLTGINAIKFIAKVYTTSKKEHLTNYVVNNPATAVLLYITSLLVDIKIFIHVHEPVSNNFNKKNALKEKLFVFLLNKAYLRALGVICISRSVKDDLKKYFPKIKPKLIYNPISISKIKNCTQPSPFSLVSEADCIFVSVGRLTKAKDYNTLIQACVELRTRNIVGYKVFIVGDGEEYHPLTLLIQKHDLTRIIYMVGFKENPTPYIKHCNCYLSTSSWEGFGLTIAYAMLLHRPIISSRTGGAIELLHPNNPFFNIGHSIDLSNHMEEFIKTRKANENVIQKNQQRVLGFDSDIVSADYINYIKERLDPLQPNDKTS